MREFNAQNTRLRLMARLFIFKVGRFIFPIQCFFQENK